MEKGKEVIGWNILYALAAVNIVKESRIVIWAITLPPVHELHNEVLLGLSLSTSPCKSYIEKAVLT